MRDLSYRRDLAPGAIVEQDFPEYEPWMNDVFILLKFDSAKNRTTPGLDYIEKFGASQPKWGCRMKGAKNLAWSKTNQWFGEAMANENWERVFSMIGHKGNSNNHLFYSEVAAILKNAKRPNPLVGSVIKGEVEGVARYTKAGKGCLRFYYGFTMYLFILLCCIAAVYYSGLYSAMPARLILVAGLLIAMLDGLFIHSVFIRHQSLRGALGEIFSKMAPRKNLALLNYRRQLGERGIFEENLANAEKRDYLYLLYGMIGLDDDLLSNMPDIDEIVITSSFNPEYAGFSLRLMCERLLRYRMERRYA